MMPELTWDTFRESIAEYVGMDAGDINEQTDVFEDLCLDSLGLFGLGANITDTFKRNVPVSSVATLSKVGELFTLLRDEGTPAEE